MITGSPLDFDRLIQIIQGFSTSYHNLIQDFKGLDGVLSQHLDADLAQAWYDKNAADPANPTSGEQSDAATFVSDIRSWQASLNNIVLNYTGAGVLQDDSFQLAKRANPRI